MAPFFPCGVDSAVVTFSSADPSGPRRKFFRIRGEESPLIVLDFLPTIGSWAILSPLLVLLGNLALSSRLRVMVLFLFLGGGEFLPPSRRITPPE